MYLNQPEKHINDKRFSAGTEVQTSDQVVLDPPQHYPQKEQQRGNSGGRQNRTDFCRKGAKAMTEGGVERTGGRITESRQQLAGPPLRGRTACEMVSRFQCSPARKEEKEEASQRWH